MWWFKAPSLVLLAVVLGVHDAGDVVGEDELLIVSSRSEMFRTCLHQVAMMANGRFPFSSSLHSFSPEVDGLARLVVIDLLRAGSHSMTKRLTAVGLVERDGSLLS